MNKLNKFEEVRSTIYNLFINLLTKLNFKHIYLLLLMSSVSILLSYYYDRTYHALKFYRISILLNILITIAFTIHIIKNYYANYVFNQLFNYFKIICRSNKRPLLAFCHDFGNAIFVISSYIQFKRHDKIKQKVNASQSIVHKVFSENFTGNFCIDNLIASKLKIMKNSNIKFDLVNDLTMDIMADEVDLCAMIGNLLDNAIEACMKVDDIEKRYINISFSNNQNFTEITVCNSINTRKPILFKTSKANKIFHGFGISNVKAIVKKYNGEFSCDQFENYFTVTIKLPSNIDLVQTLKRILPYVG